MKVSFGGSFTVNHSYNCTWFDTNNKKIKCQFMTQSYLQKIYEDGNEEELESLLHYNIKNAFDEVLICYYDAGVNALMPFEILYTNFSLVYWNMPLSHSLIPCFQKQEMHA